MPEVACSGVNDSTARSRPASPIVAARGRSDASSTMRLGERLGVAGRNDETGLPVLDDLGQPADRARDHRTAALHRLERDHPEPLAERRDDDDRRLLDRPLHRRHEAEEAHGVVQPELAHVRLQRGLERAVARDVEDELRDAQPRLRERTHEDEVALDRDEAADAEDTRHGPGVRLDAVPRRDPVVDDLEVRPRRSPPPRRGSARGPREIATCTCASDATARSAIPKKRLSRNQLKPCLVESRSGTRVVAPAIWP